MSDEEPGGWRAFSENPWDVYKAVLSKNKELILSSLWFWGVGIVPLAFIVIFRGWNETFRSGEAYLYLIGATVAVLGEVGIDLIENGTKSLKDLPSKAKIGAITQLALALAAATWGVVLVVTQPRIHHPTTSWVQVVVFFMALGYLTAIRFATKGAYNRFYGSSSKNEDQTARIVETDVEQQQVS
jgi:hypothetical protein